MHGDEKMSSSRFRVVKMPAVPTPSVSVVVPIYNMESRGYLDELISSLQSQTLESIEFILVDDCSRDQSLNAALKLSSNDDRFAILASVKNGRRAISDLILHGVATLASLTVMMLLIRHISRSFITPPNLRGRRSR